MMILRERHYPGKLLQSAAAALRPVLLASPLFLIGCGIGPAAGPDLTPSATFAGPGLGGLVHGGQQPVAGAHVYLFEAGIATGTTTTSYATQPVYAAKPKSLLSSGSGTSGLPALADADGNYFIQTDSNGNYSITAGSYSCDASDSNGLARQVYLLATGGNPGLDGTTNSYIALMTAFGDCSNLTPSSFIVANEITTAAAATALQQFANFSTGNTATPVGFSSSATNTPGLRRAMLAAQNLANITNGTANTVAPTQPTTSTAPAALLTDFANVLGGCINSDPSQSTYCNTLSTETGAASTTDTLTDALQIALNPTQNVTAMWNNIPSTSAFGKQLTAAPNDWSLAITFFPSALAANENVAIDGGGNVWTAGYSVESLLEMDNLGNVQTLPTLSGYASQRNMAIDLTGNVWVTGASTVIYTAGVRDTSKSITNQFGIAIDPTGNAWVDGGAGQLAELSDPTGTTSFAAYTPLTGVAGITSPRQIGIDQKGYGWIPNNDSPGTVAVVSLTDGANGASTATPIVGSPFAVNNGTATSYDIDPLTVAFDNSNNAFISVHGGYAQFSAASSTGGPALLPACKNAPTRGACGIQIGGSAQTAVAIDGTGNVWLLAYNTGATAGTPNTTTSNLEKFAGASASVPGTALSGANALKSDQNGLDKPYNLAIDGSGNIWTINIGATLHSGGSLVEFIGLASPVITPLAKAAAAGKLATCP